MDADALAASFSALHVSSAASAAARLDDHFSYTAIAPLPTRLECGKCFRPALDPVVHVLSHSSCGQLLCDACANRDDMTCPRCHHTDLVTANAPADIVAALNVVGVRCKVCHAEMERQEFAAHWNDKHAAAAPAEAEAAASNTVSAVAVLYKDALQAVMSLLPNADLLRSRSVSQAWKVAAWTERRARLAKEAAMQRQIKRDVENLADLTAMLMEEPTTLEGTTRFRRILSVNASPHNEAVIKLQSESGVSVVTKFVQLMEHKEAKIQYEAAWCITNLASATTEQTQIVLKHGAVPVLVKLLQSPDWDVREQAIWALSNIAGDGYVGRDHVLAAGAMDPMLALCAAEAKPKITVLRTAVWAFSNFARIKPVPNFAVLRPIVPTVVQLLQIDDDEVLTDGAWTLCYLTDDNQLFQDRLSVIVDSGVVPRLVRLLSHNSVMVQVPALRACGNLVTGNERETQAVIDAGAIPALGRMLSHPKRNIRKEIQSVLDCNFLPRLVTMMMQDEFMIQKEVTYVLANATEGSDEQIKQLEEAGAMLALANVLTCPEARVVLAALTGIENLLRASVQRAPPPPGAASPACQQLFDSDHWDSFVDLRHHANGDVVAKTVEMLSFGWFPDFEGEDDEADDDAPANQGIAADGQQFQFGAPGGFQFGQ